MKTFIQKSFKVNTNKEQTSVALELFFDFAVVAMISLIFNGFIINSHRADFDQMYLMTFAAGILGTHWYIHAFFKQRYEKKGLFFRVFTFLKVASLGIMAAGLDLLVFRENGSAASQDFLKWFAPVLFLSGVVISRAFAAFEFFCAAYANKDNEALIKLTLYKALSRALVVLLALSNLILVLVMKRDVAILTFIYMPIYLVVELIGNFAFVTKDNLKKAPGVSLEYAKNRFTKLNMLYISSLVVSGTIQFAFYFHTQQDMYMLARLAMTYTIAFLMWWAYSDRIYRLDLKLEPKPMMYFTGISLLISMVLAIFGGMLINANNNVNLDIIIPATLISLGVILMLFNVSFKFLMAKDMNRKAKWQLIFGSLPFIVILIAFGIGSIFVHFNIWVMYSIILTSLIAMNIHSRIVISKGKARL